jgi:uncharacterized protein YbjT (DUF2867 family)
VSNPGRATFRKLIAMKQVFITGGTGYMGRRLIKLLLQRGYSVTSLVRDGSVGKLPDGCSFTVGNPFNDSTFVKDISAGAIFIQLLGVAHPGPSKKELFRKIDLASVKASAKAAKKAGVQHFIYVSVAQTPTNIMKDYQQCRAEGEAAILDTQIPATFIRPWYVVGPGHYWPLLFTPMMKIMEWIPPTSAKARALRLVTLKQMLHALIYAVENMPVNGLEVIEIDSIRKM